MPEGFRRLIQGFHALDHGDMDAGLRHLSHPSVVPTYPAKIIDTFVASSVRHKNGQPAETATGYSHVIAYITAKCPLLVSQRSIDLYMSALCSASVYSALDFARGVSDIDESLDETEAADEECAKTRLLKALINACLSASASPASQAAGGRPRKNPIHNLFQSSPTAWRLANLPFTPSESEVVEDILTSIIAGTAADDDTSSRSKAKNGTLERNKISLAKDVLLLRALHTGDMEAASRIGSLGNFKLASAVTAKGPGQRRAGARRNEQQDQEQKGVDWNDITRGLSLGLNA